jgi:uncharacterized tellurite resistance protein B-like protein
MLKQLKKYFAKDRPAYSRAQNEEPMHDIRIAACAIFLEMANADSEFSEAERESVLSILKNNYMLSDEDAQALIAASREAREKSIDLWQFTNRINLHYTTEEKIRIIEMLWEIIYADGRLDEHEDYLVHKLARLLRLKHQQLIEAKLRVLHP